MLSRLAILIGTALTLSGCATSYSTSCAPPSRAMAQAEMFFGRNVGRHTGVSEAVFSDFLKREIAPRFPQGFTVIDARGQWREPDGALVTEPSKVVVIVFDDTPRAREALGGIAQAYKSRFRQQSVLTTVRPTCASM